MQLGNSWDEINDITRFFMYLFIAPISIWFNSFTSLEVKYHHVFLWFDAQCCKDIMEEIRKRGKSIYRNRIKLETNEEKMESSLIT